MCLTSTQSPKTPSKLLGMLFLLPLYLPVSLSTSTFFGCPKVFWTPLYSSVTVPSLLSSWVVEKASCTCPSPILTRGWGHCWYWSPSHSLLCHFLPSQFPNRADFPFWTPTSPALGLTFFGCLYPSEISVNFHISTFRFKRSSHGETSGTLRHCCFSVSHPLP